MASGSTTTIGVMSNYLETRILNHVLRNIYYSAPPSVYVGLFKSHPGESGSAGTEVTSGSGYVRMRLTNSFYAPVDGETSNRLDIRFPVASGSWGTVTHAAIFTGSTIGGGGTANSMLFYGELRDSKNITEGSTFFIPAKGFKISLISEPDSSMPPVWGEYFPTSYGIYFANTYLNHLLNGSNYNGPMSEVYICLYNTIPDLDDVGGIEVRGAESGMMPVVDYERKKYYGTSNWSTPSSGSTSNSASIVFTYSALADWGTIEGICIRSSKVDYGAQSSLIYRGYFASPIRVSKGDGLFFSASSIKITAN